MTELHGEAMSMALRARDLDPDMVAASDAVIRASQTFGMADVAEEELARIMAIAPNHGSLLRASNSLCLHWGGSVDAIAQACRGGDVVDDAPVVAQDESQTRLVSDSRMRQGEPVPVIITIELTFTLR